VNLPSFKAQPSLFDWTALRNTTPRRAPMAVKRNGSHRVLEPDIAQNWDQKKNLRSSPPPMWLGAAYLERPGTDQ